MSMKFEGLKELQKALGQLENKATSEMIQKEAVIRGAEVLKEEVINKAPKKTGKLKESITITSVENGKVSVHTGEAFYSHFLEFGTTKVAAKPFMEPAFNAKKEEIQEAMADVIKRELRL